MPRWISQVSSDGGFFRASQLRSEQVAKYLLFFSFPSRAGQRAEGEPVCVSLKPHDILGLCIIANSRARRSEQAEQMYSWLACPS